MEQANEILAEAETIQNKSDYDKGFDDAKAQFTKAVNDGVYIDGDKYREKDRQLSNLTQDFNELQRKYNELSAGLDLEAELEE